MRSRAKQRVGLALGIIAWAACGEHEPPLAQDPAAPRVSLFATGDTGRRHRPLASWFEGQLAVAHAMAEEDRRSPVDALVLLGDNFYPHGLVRGEVVERVRENLALPYCRFVELAGPRSREVASHCPAEVASRNVVPLIAVPGNHDLESPESLDLQCHAVPEFISNWNMLCDFVATFELDGGLSVIVYDSAHAGWEQHADRLAEAIGNAKGPWRILMSHHPLGVDREDRPAPAKVVPEAIRAAGVAVHAHLAGHNHNLQVFADGAQVPPLRIVVGSGARARPPITAPHPDRDYGEARLGFARVDVVDDDAHPQLRVSLFATPWLPILSWGDPELVARWSVDLEGRVRNEIAP